MISTNWNVSVSLLQIKVTSDSDVTMEKHVEFVEDRPFQDLRYTMDSSKLHTLGWQPKISWEDGINQTSECLQGHLVLISWFRDPVLMRRKGANLYFISCLYFRANGTVVYSLLVVTLNTSVDFDFFCILIPLPKGSNTKKSYQSSHKELFLQFMDCLLAAYTQCVQLGFNSLL